MAARNMEKYIQEGKQIIERNRGFGLTMSNVKYLLRTRDAWKMIGQSVYFGIAIGYRIAAKEMKASAAQNKTK